MAKPSKINYTWGGGPWYDEMKKQVFKPIPFEQFQFKPPTPPPIEISLTPEQVSELLETGQVVLKSDNPFVGDTIVKEVDPDA